MATHRVTISDRIIQRLQNEYTNKIQDEFGINASSSILVTLALLELQSMKENTILDIKFNKNGKIKYKFK